MPKAVSLNFLVLAFIKKVLCYMLARNVEQWSLPSRNLQSGKGERKIESSHKSTTATTMGSLKETRCYENLNREFNLVKRVGKSSMGKRKDKELTKYVSNKPFLIGFF